MNSLEPFGARLRHAMDERGPLCVGIDPHASLLAEWGLDDDVAGLERFSRTVVEAVADRVAVLKPQSAFFERFGSRGLAVLETSVREARESVRRISTRRQAPRWCTRNARRCRPFGSRGENARSTPWSRSPPKPDNRRHREARRSLT